LTVLFPGLIVEFGPNRFGHTLQVVHDRRGVKAGIDRGDLHVRSTFGAQHVGKGIGRVLGGHVARPGLVTMNESGNAGQVNDTTIRVDLSLEDGQKGLAASDQAKVVY
jgi:hypothetical protein